MTPRGGFRRGLIVLVLVGGVIAMHSLNLGHGSGSLTAVQHTASVHAPMNSGGVAAAAAMNASANREPSGGGTHPATSICLAVLSISMALLLTVSVRHRVRRAFRRQRLRAVLMVELFLPGTPWISRSCVLRT